MNKGIHPQYITDEHGKRVSVVLPIQQWQKVLDELEELDDIRLYDSVKARSKPTVSLAEYRKKTTDEWLNTPCFNENSPEAIR